MKPTRAMVLAAGLGVRMRPLTALRPKPALPVLNRPLIAHLLDHLAGHGVRMAVINTHHMSDELKEAVRTSAPAQMEIAFSHETQIMGTAGGLKLAAAYFTDGPFFLANSDSLTDADLTAAAAAHTASGRAATMIVKPHRPDEGYRPVMVAGRLDALRVAGIAGKTWGAELGDARTFTGIHVLERSVLDAIPSGRPCDINADIYPQMLEKNPEAVGAWLHEGWWFEAGGPARYLELNLDRLLHEYRQGGEPQLYGEGTRVDARSQASVDGSVLGAGCTVDAHARISDSLLWNRVRVTANAVLDHCIVTDDVHVQGTFADSILMKDAHGKLAVTPLEQGS